MPGGLDNSSDDISPQIKDKKNRLAVILSALGLLIFLLISVTFTFRDQLFSNLFPKPPSHAQVQGGTAIFTAEIPSCGTVGPEIAVPIMVRSDVDAANLFAAKINYPVGSLDVLRIETTSSFVTQWVEATFDNATGQISIIGGVPTPGFKTSGADAQMAVVVFKATQTGNFNISFDNASVIYRDSDSSDILGTVNGGTLIVSDTCLSSPSPSASATPLPTGAASPTPTPSSGNASLSLGANSCSNLTDDIIVKVLVRSDADAANLFSSKINFPETYLEVTGFDRTDSFITNWVEETFNNTTGKVSVIGGVPNPGFQTRGTDGILDQIIFHAKQATTSATISFDNSSAIYRNSDNNDILGTTTGTSLSLSALCSSSSPSPSASATSNPAGGTGVSCSFNGPTTLSVGQTGVYNSTSGGNISSFFWSASGGLPNSGVNSTFSWSAGVPGNYTLALTVQGSGGQKTCDAKIGVSAASGGTNGSNNRVPNGPPVTGRGG